MKTDLIERPSDTLAKAGQTANKKAASRAFVEFRSRRAENTLRRYDADLALFAEFLRQAGGESVFTSESAHSLSLHPEAWHDITWGLVDEFVRWQLAKGYAISTVNFRLYTIRVFAKLALKAGVLDGSEYTLIRSVDGYSRREGHNLNEKRRKAGMDTRIGNKKAEPVFLSADQVEALKEQPDTPKGRRDRLLVCLALDHGLRVSELAILQRGDFDLKAGTMTFYRPKINEKHTHKLEPDTLQAAISYLTHDAPETGCIWRTSTKGRPSLSEQGISTRAINKRIRFLGDRAGIDTLSPHDLRHTGATIQASKLSIDELKRWGGWTTYAMAERYIKAAEIAFKGSR